MGFMLLFTLNLKSLETLFGEFGHLGYRGVNVTIPHKVEVMNYLDEIDEGARIVGAVNTIVNEAASSSAYNTDGIGYVRSLKEETGIELKGKSVLLLGAGGAARGVAYALGQGRRELYLYCESYQSTAVELATTIRRLHRKRLV